jgi:hypothetical protein
MWKRKEMGDVVIYKRSGYYRPSSEVSATGITTATYSVVVMHMVGEKIQSNSNWQ